MLISKILKSEIGETVFAPGYPQKVEGMSELDVVHSAGWHRVTVFGDYRKQFAMLFKMKSIKLMEEDK